MLRSYLRLTLFAFGLLVGVQVPGFIDAYAKHVEARRLEAEQGLHGFQDTARRFFSGDLDALVQHYRDSDDPVFQNDAQSVEHLVARARLLEREWQAMQRPWYARAIHVLLGAERSLREQVWSSYRFQVLLAPEAIAWGLSCALLLAWLVESLLLAASFPFRSRRRYRAFRS
ncbi:MULTISPECIES: DUF2937 family protein [Stutzerimonas]|jgi:hypothetical protein|nr:MULTISPECIES: DUF2937 family protein [Stutzerimonas stutzeri subgroup]MBU2332634.1 DUF2937 family protein [Gammaproteobacteria bacterium]HCH79051.1 DUF2937 domain-containing protein [Pseudomonas sp.]MCD1608806.1 DUF2937 family protein [Stutzerimonas kunmingensis]MCQ2039086.1 DUF2937 family protein [Stutzerimonas kunmingensis]MCQ4290592.1 DUF2937 family protein [Stutzerimonas stutzeri]|tara:strand:- start:629 stop:1144 length:516 start_codon:yes stop_codon:yes gene_type:complete